MITISVSMSVMSGGYANSLDRFLINFQQIKLKQYSRITKFKIKANLVIYDSNVLFKLLKSSLEIYNDVTKC